MGETAFKKRIRPVMDALPSSYWFKIQQVVIRDTPDFLGVVSGFFVGWELKKAKAEKARRSQLQRLYRINLAGGWGRLVYPENFEEELQFLRDLPKLMLNRAPCPTIEEFYAHHGYDITESLVSVKRPRSRR